MTTHHCAATRDARPPRACIAGLLLRALAQLLLLCLAWSGLSGGLHQLSRADGELQRLQSVLQVAFGGLALVMIVAAYRRVPAVALLRTGWLLCVALASALAARAWGGAPWWSALLTGGIGLLIAGLPLALERIGRRLRG